jgi:hypothetical protein
VFAASSLEDAAREQYAAMQAGGGAVAAPPKKGQLKDRQAAGRHRRKSGESWHYALPRSQLLPRKLAAQQRARKTR